MKTILIPIDSSKELPPVEKFIPSHGISVSCYVWTDQDKMMFYDFHHGYWSDTKWPNPIQYKTESVTWYKEVLMLDFLSKLKISYE